MKAYLRIICKKTSGERLKNQIVDFLKYIHAELVAIEDDTYWKEPTCTVFDVEFIITRCTSENLKEAIEKFFVSDKLEEVICTEKVNGVEFDIYTSYQDTMQYDRVFLVLNINKETIL